MKTIQVGTIPRVKVKRNRSLSIAGKIAKQVGLEVGQVLSVIRDGERVILEPLADANRTKVLAALDRGLRDVASGRRSPAFSDMEEMDRWLDRKLK